MNPRVEKVHYVDNYSLKITFKNGEVKLFDVSPYLEYPIYEILKDREIFKNAHILNGTVAWNDEIDFDPDTLYLEGKPGAS